MSLPAARAAGRDSVVPFAALLLFTVMLFLAPQAYIPGLGRVRIALLVGAVAILTHAWTRFAAGRPVMRRTREMWLVAALLVWMVLTLPLSQWPSTSARVLLGDYLKTVGVFWLLSNVVSSARRLRAVAWMLSVVAVPLAATGLWNFVSGNLMPGGMPAGGRIAGFDAPLTSDANTLAMVLNLILPLSIALMLTSRPLVRGLLAALIVLDVSAIIVTFSRGGFLTLAIIFVFHLVALFRWGHRRLAVAALVFVIAAIPVLPLGYLDRIRTISNIEGDEAGSAQSRWSLTVEGLRYALTHPLVGAGLGMSILADCRQRGISAGSCARECAQTPIPPCLLVHNVYLQYAMDLGWVGLGLFVLLLASCVGGTVRVGRHCTGQPGVRELAIWAEAIRITIVGFAVNALFFPWGYFIYFYFVAGLAVALAAVHETEAWRSQPAGRRGGPWWTPIPA